MRSRSCASFVPKVGQRVEPGLFRALKQDKEIEDGCVFELIKREGGEPIAQRIAPFEWCDEAKLERDALLVYINNLSCSLRDELPYTYELIGGVLDGLCDDFEKLPDVDVAQLSAGLEWLIFMKLNLNEVAKAEGEKLGQVNDAALWWLVDRVLNFLHRFRYHRVLLVMNNLTGMGRRNDPVLNSIPADLLVDWPSVSISKGQVTLSAGLDWRHSNPMPWEFGPANYAAGHALVRRASLLLADSSAGFSSSVKRALEYCSAVPVTSWYKVDFTQLASCVQPLKSEGEKASMLWELADDLVDFMGRFALGEYALMVCCSKGEKV